MLLFIGGVVALFTGFPLLGAVAILSSIVWALVEIFE